MVKDDYRLIWQKDREESVFLLKRRVGLHRNCKVSIFAYELIAMLKHNLVILRTIMVAFLTVIATMPLFSAVDFGKMRSITSKDGLSDLLVNVIYKDTAGYVWFGTESGLDRFDGNRVQSFSLESGNTNKSRRVNAVTSGVKGSIFAGTNVGLFELAPGSNTPVRLFPDRISGAVSSLAPDGRGTLYIGTDNGIFILKEGNRGLKHRLVVPDMMSSANKVKALAMDKNRGLWILAEHALHYLSHETDNIITYPLNVSSEASHLRKVGNVLYVGTQGNGIVPFSLEGFRFGQPVGVGNNVVTSICAAGNGSILVSTDGEGIFLYSPSERRVDRYLSASVGNSRSLRSNSVYSTLVDDNCRLWVGYYQSGVDYTPSNNAYISLYEFPGLPDMSRSAVRSLAIDGPRRVIGTHEGFYYVDEEKGIVRHVRKPEISSNLIFCVTVWAGCFYVGTYHGGAYVFNPEDCSVRRFGPPETEGESVFDMEVGPGNSLWVATSSGVYRFDKPGAHVAAIYTSANSHLPSGNVYEIFFDSMGRGWLCTEQGMAIWNGRKISATGFPKDFPFNVKMRAVYEDSRHRLYFVPDRGAIKQSNIELSRISVLGGESDDRFKMRTFVTEDIDGGLWVGTDTGLWRYREGMQPSVVNNLNGTSAPVFTLCKPYREKNGDIWFGTVNGLYKLNYHDFKEAGKQKMSDIYISDMKSNGIGVGSGRIKSDRYKTEISLKQEESDLEVYIANFDYCDPEFFEVEYYQEGVDKGWKITNGSTPVHLFNLPKGVSRVHFRLPGEPGSEKILTVRRAGNLNGWYILAAVFLAVGAGVVWMVSRNKSAVRQVEEPLSAEDTVADTATEQKKASYRTTRLTDEECMRLYRKLEQLMKKERPYVSPDIKISDLAGMADTTAHALSFLFNQYLEKSYYDYINEYRVAEFKRIVTELDTSRYTLTALSQKCGFSSRASFFRHFKNITGITPAEYLKNIKSD